MKWSSVFQILTACLSWRSTMHFIKLTSQSENSFQMLNQYTETMGFLRAPLPRHLAATGCKHHMKTGPVRTHYICSSVPLGQAMLFCIHRGSNTQSNLTTPMHTLSARWLMFVQFVPDVSVEFQNSNNKKRFSKVRAVEKWFKWYSDITLNTFCKSENHY